MARNEILYLICEAQRMSDAAKDTRVCEDKRDFYALKSRAVLRAVRECFRGKDESVVVDVHRDVDQNGVPAYIVYFKIKNCKYGHETKQVSFHGFDNRLRTFVKGNRQHWEQCGRGNSYRNALFLEQELYNDNFPFRERLTKSLRKTRFTRPETIWSDV